MHVNVNARERIYWPARFTREYIHYIPSRYIDATTYIADILATTTTTATATAEGSRKQGSKQKSKQMKNKTV